MPPLTEIEIVPELSALQVSAPIVGVIVIAAGCVIVTDVLPVQLLVSVTVKL